MKLLPILLICTVEMLGNFQYNTIVDLSTTFMYGNTTTAINFNFMKSLHQNKKVDKSEFKRFVRTWDGPTFAQYLKEINVEGELFSRNLDGAFYRNYSTFFNYDIFFTLVFLLIADSIRYRWIIILGSISVMMRHNILNFSKKPRSDSLSTVEFLNAVYQSSMIATHTYLYSKIRDKSTYQKITTYVTISGILGLFCTKWILLRLESSVVDLFEINRSKFNEQQFYTLDDYIQYLFPLLVVYISRLWQLILSILEIASNPFISCIMLLCSYFLPPVDAEKSNSNDEEAEDSRGTDLAFIIKFQNMMRSCLNKVQEDAALAWVNFQTAFTDKTVLKWSIWYTTVSCFVSLMSGYELSFFTNWFGEIVIKDKDDEIMSEFKKMEDFAKNTLADMTLIPLLSTGVILLILCSAKSTIWKAREDIVLCLISFAAFIAMITVHWDPMDFPNKFKKTQILLIIVRVSLTVCFWKIVQIIPKNSYALVIGFNIFVSKLLNRIIFYHVGDQIIFPSYEPDFMIPFTIWFALMGLVFGAFAMKPSFFEELLKKLPNQDLKLSRRERNDNGV